MPPADDVSSVLYPVLYVSARPQTEHVAVVGFEPQLRRHEPEGDARAMALHAASPAEVRVL